MHSTDIFWQCHWSAVTSVKFIFLKDHFRNMEIQKLASFFPNLSSVFTDTWYTNFTDISHSQGWIVWSHLISQTYKRQWKAAPKQPFLRFQIFTKLRLNKGAQWLLNGEVSQLSLISLEGSCLAKTWQLPSSWLRLWEPVRKAKMHFTPLKAYMVSVSVVLLLLLFLTFLLFSLSLSLFPRTHKKVARSHKRFWLLPPG